MNPKKFIRLFFTLFIIFSIYHYSVWKLFTSQIFDTGDKYIGDLARMSYQTDALFPRKTETTIKSKHLQNEEYILKKVDIVTIGDSFFNGGGGGKNPFFQDYLTDYTKKNILNIQLYGNSMDIVNILRNSGWLKKVKPKIIIIESTARDVVARFAYNHNFDKSIELKKVEKNLFSDIWKFHKQNVYFINEANYKLPLYSLLYRYNEHAQKNVYKLKLDEEMFSIKHYKSLLVYKDDIQRLEQQNLKNIALVNKNMNILAEKLKKLNIKLYFMPIVNKYDLYYSHILDNHHEKDNFFPLLRKLQKDYYLVDTKRILMPLIKLNEKDIFYADDTHWSYIASKQVAYSLSKTLQ